MIVFSLFFLTSYFVYSCAYFYMCVCVCVCVVHAYIFSTWSFCFSVFICFNVLVPSVAVCVGVGDLAWVPEIRKGR